MSEVIIGTVKVIMKGLSKLYDIEVEGVKVAVVQNNKCEEKNND